MSLNKSEEKVFKDNKKINSKNKKSITLWFFGSDIDDFLSITFCAQSFI